jgi:hypothetical protein
MLRLIKYVKVTAILQNLFMMHEPPKDWILPEDKDEHFVNALEFVGHNLTIAQVE